MHFNSLIGKPYDIKEWNCWSLIEYFYPHLRGLDLKITESVIQCRRLTGQTLTSLQNLYEFVDEPKHFDIAVMSGHHVGIVIMPGRNILHVSQNIGTVVEPESIIKCKYPRIRFIRCR